MIEQMSAWVLKQIDRRGADGALVGLSGDVDSAVVAGILTRVLPQRCLGVLLPCDGTSQTDIDYAHKVADKFDMPTATMDLSETFDSLHRSFDSADLPECSRQRWPRTAISIPDGTEDPALHNSKPRLRMLALFYAAESLNFLVAGTTNKSELLTGYYTNYGDLAADFGLLGGLFKTQVWELAEELGVPREIIERPPSAGMASGQTDEEELALITGVLMPSISRKTRRSLPTKRKSRRCANLSAGRKAKEKNPSSGQTEVIYPRGRLNIALLIRRGTVYAKTPTQFL